MTSTNTHEIEIPLEETELLRVQLLNERVVSAREAVTAASLLQQVRQSELDALISSLLEKYKSEAEGMELKGFNLQKRTVIFGPSVKVEE